MLLAPSILAGNLADLQGVARTCATGGADMLHVDVMDGHFVPNLTFGPPVVQAVAAASSLPLDVHLMVESPERLLGEYLDARPARLAVHWEATTHLDRVLAEIRARGAQAGVALNPATPVAALEDALPTLDFVLLMSVNPGFAGQPFLPYVVEKARKLKETIERRSLAVTLAMDGGIGPENIAEIVAAGVELCVSGSSVFDADDPAAAMRDLRERARQERE